MNKRVQTRPRVKGTDQFFTPDALSQKIVDWAGISPDGCRVLEPSAGDGAFAKLIIQRPKVQLTCVEYDTVFAARLEKELKNLCHETSTFKVYADDFLAFSTGSVAAKPFDLAIMNPPYGSRGNKKKGIPNTAGLGHKHVAHALKFARKVVALVPADFEFGVLPDNLIFKHNHMTRRARLVRRPRFYGPNDKGLQARRAYAVMEFESGYGWGDNEHQWSMIETFRWNI